MQALTPWTGLATLKKEMDRLFDRFWEADLPELPSLMESWSPLLDLAETKEALTVKAEVSGIEPKEIEVSLQDQILTIKGERKHEKEEKDERYHRRERSHGSFTRSIRLPVPVEGSKVTATFKNGLLTITLPKTPAAKGTTIPVKTE